MHPIHQWREVREQLRLNKIYQGLRVSDDRPRYIFDGKSREYYRRFHPDKKTKAVFVPGFFHPIMGGSPGTYYMRADGTAENLGEAIGPETDASACMTIAIAEDETFVAADLIYMADNGGDYRDQFNPPSSGSAGSQITFQNIAGQSPVINGADIVTTWSDEGSNVWSASFTPGGTEAAPQKVFFDETLGTEEPGGTGDLNAANEWYYDAGADILYVYSTSDPDTAYTSPGIEATSRDECIYIYNKTYVTIDGIDVKYAILNNLRSGGATGHDHIFKNITSTHAGKSGFLGQEGATNTYLYNVRCTYCGTDGLAHGFYLNFGGDDNGEFLLENCTGDNAQGWGCQTYGSRGGVIKNSLFHSNQRGGTVFDEPVAGETFSYQYCMARDNGGGSSLGGFAVVGFAQANATVNYYNCVAYNNTGTGWAAGFSISEDQPATCAINIKNCISYEGVGDYEDLAVQNATATITLDYNCFYRASGQSIFYVDTGYTSAQFSTYQSEKSQDANSMASDPLFIDAAGGDFHLKSNSPCIDVGVDVGLSNDKDGIPLGRGTAPDMGAHETLKGGPRRF